MMQQGTVIKSTGSWYQVRLNDGQLLESRMVGKFRLGSLKLTNPVAVGDQVLVDTGDDGKGLIVEILPRRNYVIRQSPRKKQYLHLLASNVDQALIIATIAEPNLKQGFIDRFLLMTEPYNIPTAVVFNKADIYQKTALDLYTYLQSIYEPIGYTMHLVSALGGQGLGELKNLLKDKVTLIGGQSGVGKSTLVNAIQPNLDLKTFKLSGHSGKGQHTTTFAEMFELEFGGSIIDTPGIKTLAFNNLKPLDVAHNFREFFTYSSQCKFGGQCLHRSEPHCAVKDAIETGGISELRYQNYLSILDDIENQNYWEIHET